MQLFDFDPQAIFFRDVEMLLITFSKAHAPIAEISTAIAAPMVAHLPSSFPDIANKTIEDKMPITKITTAIDDKMSSSVVFLQATKFTSCALGSEVFFCCFAFFLLACKDEIE